VKDNACSCFAQRVLRVTIPLKRREDRHALVCLDRGVLVAGAIAAGDVAGIAAPDPRSQLADAKDNLPSVELVIAVDVSYSMDMDELAVQREGYTQAIVSKEFLQALKTGPNSKVAVTYFEWSASSDQKIIIPWRVIDGPETADAIANEIMKTPVRRAAGLRTPARWATITIKGEHTHASHPSS
jgi:Protein of unknown function (DUF1194)